jgi:hypothetical protein
VPCTGLLDLFQSAVHNVSFRLALMFCEIRQQLFLGFVGIRDEFLPRPESQSAHITIGDARCGPHKSHDLHISLSHANMIAGEEEVVKFSSCLAFRISQSWPENPLRKPSNEVSNEDE